MATLISHGSARSESWKEYEISFQEFSRTAASVQLLAAKRSVDHPDFTRAVVDLEDARIRYNHARDTLAAELLESSVPLGPDPSQIRRSRTKRIAELLWESAGQPSGTAIGDWHRAEEIIDRLVQRPA